MSDESIKLNYLREAGLFCDDPMGQHPLHGFEKLTIDSSGLSPENRYNFRSKYVFCHACGRHNHYKGITVKSQTGSLALIGNCCAEEFFGKDAYQRIERALRDREDEQYYKRAIAPLAGLLHACETQIHGIVHLGNALEGNWDFFEQLAGSHLSSLKNACARNLGRLTIEKQVLDYSSDSAIEREARKSITEIVAVVRGSAFVARRDTVRAEYKLLQSYLSKYRARLSGPINRLFEMRDMVMKVQSNINPRIESLNEQLTSGVAFFDRENIKQVCAWLDRIDRSERGLHFRRAEKTMAFGFELPDAMRIRPIVLDAHASIASSATAVRP